MAETLSGYCYTNPTELDLRPFVVVEAGVSLEYSEQVARRYQEIMNKALRYQFPSLKPQAIAQTADPDNLGYVALQATRVQDSEGLEKPTYFEARYQTVDPAGRGLNWDICGIGKAKYADGRSRWVLKLALPTSRPNNLADIGDVFVQPDLFLTSRDMRYAGIGSAIMHSMLDVYPDDMPAVFYGYPQLNPRITALAQKYGFREDIKRDREVVYCRQVTLQRLYNGPTVKELAATMVSRRPWLKQRTPIELRA